MEPIRPADVVLIAFPLHEPRAHEQEGIRPAVVAATVYARFPLLIVLPLTSRSGSWVDQFPQVYFRIPAGDASLPRDSVVLLDQIRSVSIERIQGRLGRLPEQRYAMIHQALLALLEGSCSSAN